MCAGARAHRSRPAKPASNRKGDVIHTDNSNASKAHPALLTERLQQHARSDPDRLAYTFLRDDGKVDQVTYGQLHGRAEALAATLAQQAPKGARALLLYPAGLEFITVYFACLMAGLIAVPATIPHKTRASRRLKALLDDADPALILTRSDCEPAIRASLSLVDADARTCLSTDTLVLCGDAAALPLPDADSTAFLQYTSGSTSLPKGVEITHLNIASNVEAIRQGFGFTPDTVMVSWLPLFHDMGLIGSVVAPMYVGFHCVLMAPAAFLKNPAMWLDAISTYRGTCAGAPNFGWDYCAKKILDVQKERFDLRSLKVAYNGSEPIRAETLRRFASAFAPCGMAAEAMFPCYGMAETTLFVAGGPVDSAPRIHTVSKSLLEGNQIRAAQTGDDDAREIVSSGRIAADTTVLIVDPETCLPVSSQRVGEVWVAGPGVARGYWNRPAETAAIFGAMLADSGAGPFLRTGDLAFMRDGELFITGRLKDLIIINGRNVYPQDVEEVIERAIDFIEPNMCAAFSVEIDGQERLAIVAEANRSLVRAAQQAAKDASKAEQLRAKDDYLAKIESMAHNICQVIGQQFDVSVSSIVFVKPGTFPRTTSGKVQRTRCRDMAVQGLLDVVYVMPGSIFDRRGSREQVVTTRPAPSAAAERAPEPAAVAAHVASGSNSAATADAMISWFRQYAARRLNSRIIDERRTIPPYVVLDLGNQGFFGLQVAARFGGKGLDTVDLMRVLEQLAAVDLSLATLVGVHNGLGVRPLQYAATPALREQLLPRLAEGRQLAAFALTEPHAGSNPMAIRTRAIRSAGGWRVTGEKQWIGLGAWASVTTVFAKAIDPAGGPLGIVALVVREDNAGLSQGPEALTMGMRGMVQNTVLLNEAFVPDADVLLTPGEGMDVARDAMLFSRLGIGAMCVGAMKRCAQLMGRYAARREIASGRLSEHAVSIERLQSLTSAVFATHALVYAVAAQLDAGRGVPAEAYIACKTNGSELLGEASDALVQMLGGRGYIESNSAPQILRDARVLRILEGPTETLYAHLGAAIGNPACPALEFIGTTLGQCALAAELSASVARVKAAAALRTGLFASGAVLAQWVDYQLGALTAAAMLLAAAQAQPPAATGTAAAVAWARQRYLAMGAAIDTRLAGQPAFATSADLLSQIAAYTGAIGDVEQQLPGENDRLDPVLRLAPERPAAASAPATDEVRDGAKDGATAPATPPAPAVGIGTATSMQAIVHECVMQWLRGENPSAPEGIDFDTPFTSLGMDSMATASISFALEERIGFAIIPEILYDHQTVNQLAAFIENRCASEPAPALEAAGHPA
jgi:acyl-CoA synthetase (AMP-forming)/AMP-acid ligase II/alkylation response protein AidB-like acyl-CoA dehydrogenase/acyl carrier protein